MFEMIGGQRAVSRRERRAAASKTRSVCAGLNPMPSQNASTASTSFSSASAGSIVLQTSSM
jgi:hypothetical protein